MSGLNIKPESVFGNNQNVSVAPSTDNCQVPKAGSKHPVRFVILLTYCFNGKFPIYITILPVLDEG